MPELVKSSSLRIAGFGLGFSHPVSWPTTGALSCYLPFLTDGQATDTIDLELCRGLPCRERDPSYFSESTDDGIRWYGGGDARFVERFMVDSPEERLWALELHLRDSRGTLYFSDFWLRNEECAHGWPIAALRYPIDQHIMIHFLPFHDAALIHAAGAVCAGRGFLCAGVSGAGKTTMSRLLADDDRFALLTDDRVITRSGDPHREGEPAVSRPRVRLGTASLGMTVHGTPWTGEGQYATAGEAPLKAAFFLHKAKEDRVERLNTQQAVERFMPVTSVPWFDEQLTTLSLKHIEKLARTIPAYDLHFTATPSAPSLIARVLEEMSA